MRRLPAALVAAGLLALAGCGSGGAGTAGPASAPSSSGAPAPGCADLVVLGLRGQAQSPTKVRGVGAEVLGTYDAIAAREPAGTSVRLVAVRHPARSTPTQAAYDADVATGVRMVQRRLGRLADRCPNSRLGLVGFSEGAQVVHLAAARTARPLALVVLMGDPLRDPDADVRTLTFGTRVTGRGSNGPGPAFPAGVRRHVVEACVAGDNVCNVPPTGRVGGVSATHREFYEKPSSSRQIAAAVTSR